MARELNRLARGELHDAVFKVGCAAMAGMAEGEDGDLLRRAQEKSGLEHISDGPGA